NRYQVVDGADQTEGPGDGEHEEPARRESGEADAAPDAYVGTDVSKRSGGEEHEPAHRRRSVLHEMSRRTVLAYERAYAPRTKQVDHPRCEEEAHHERHGRAEKDALHSGVLALVRTQRARKVLHHLHARRLDEHP